MFEAVGNDHFLIMDIHNLAAFQNAFRSTTSDHLEATQLFVDYFDTMVTDNKLAVVSPDIGGIKRADRFSAALRHQTRKNITSGFMQKQRSEGVVTSGRFPVVIHS